MVDWKDPGTIQIQRLALVNFCHLLSGIFFWEFCTTVSFEWALVKNGRALRFAPMVYMWCRWLTLGAMISEVVGFNLHDEYNCEAWYIALTTFAFTAIGAASLLIVLRGIAIWNRRWLPTCFLIGVWLTNVGFLLHGLIAGAHSVWDDSIGACTFPDRDSARDNVVVTLVTDVILLCAAIIGLLRMQLGGGLWKRILNQEIIWIASATFFGLPGTVFLVLDLNEPMDIMFQSLTMVSMTICATRMFRDLSEYAKQPIQGDLLNRPSLINIARESRPSD
ncbi:uncharacterized protein STEHIDRAFT_141688, partial [Stereum hirsutum FP-91666 SS1]|uniref:uncharacterized protein n=1 Tax=Stereum hirsutum (strain FP-91666) TaxID=721885 RepID=UPI00044492DB